MHFRHTVGVSRHSEAVVDRKRVMAWSTVIASAAVLIEALPSRQKPSILGRMAGAAYTMTWGLDDIREGDRVAWNGQTFTVKEITRDTTRPTGPYQTCILDRKLV